MPFLFVIGIWGTIIFSALKFMGKIDWEWKWVLSPLLIFLILSSLHNLFIKRPKLKEILESRKAIEDNETEEAMSETDLGWDNRTLCIDESCTGTIGEDGFCRECGKLFKK